MIAGNLIAVICHTAFGVYILHRYPRYTVLFGLVYFVQTWSLISCGYNDLGIYNVELFRHTEPSLATTRLALFFVVFNLGFLAVARLLRDARLTRCDYDKSSGALKLGNFKVLAYAAVGIVTAYVTYTFATDGIPLFQGVHKLLFYQRSGPIDRMILDYGFLFAFILGFLHKGERRISVSTVLLGVMLLYMVLTGNKFSALLKLLIAFYAATFVSTVTSNPRFTLFRRKYIAIIGVTIVIFVVGAYFSYTHFGRDSASALHWLTDRLFALQGHLWWATDFNLFVNGEFDSGHWLAELNALLAPATAPDGSAGMKYVMVQAIGAEHAFPIFDIGYLYTMAYPAILVLTFPYPVALLIQFLAGGTFALLLYYLHYSVLYRHFFRSVVAITIIIPLIGMLNTGDFHTIITPGIFIKALILAVLELGIQKSPTQASAGQTNATATATGVEQQ